MADFRHKLNGLVIDEPRNWQDLEITKDFLGKKEDGSINITELEFAGDVAIQLIDRIKNGMNGGVGIFEGEPYEIEVGEQGNPAFTFKGYLDFAEDVQIVGCNEVKVSLKKEQGSDWLSDVADSFSFRYLESIGVISSGDFIKVPYIINYVPDNMQLIILSMSLFMVTKELVETIRTLAETIGDVTNAATPVIGVSVGVGVGAVTAWDIGDVVMVSIKVVSNLAYTIGILIAIKNLIEEIIEQLIPKKRNHLGMGLKRLFEKGCQQLGLTLSSSLLNDRSNWVIIPSKGHKGGEKPTGFKGNWKETGVPSSNDPWDTFGDLIRKWSEYLYADFKIVNGVFHFERADHWDSMGAYTIGDYFTNQEDLKDEYRPNASEIKANYNITWAYDTQDQNTLDNSQGMIFQAITEPIVENNKKLRNLKGLETVGIQASMGLRKDNLTKVEDVLKGLAKFVDKVTGILGGGTSYASKIENRKGSLLLSSHFTTIPKVVVMNGGKLAMNQREILSAEKLWEDLHYISSFVEIKGSHNQWLRFEQVKVPFCIEDFITLLDNHFCKTSDGKDAMIETLKWRVWDNTAVIDYRINEKYTENLKIKYVT